MSLIQLGTVAEKSKNWGFSVTASYMLYKILSTSSLNPSFNI